MPDHIPIKMHLILITRVNTGNPVLVGVTKKIHGQVEALRELGNTSDLMYIQGSDVVVEAVDGRRTISRLRHAWSRFLFYHFGLFRFLRSGRPYDGLLIRHFRMDPLFLFQLWRFKTFSHPGCKIVLEVPTYPYDREGHDQTWLDRIESDVDHWTLTWLANIVFSRVLTYSRYDRIWGVSTIQTDNGISVTGIAPPPPRALDRVFRMIAITSVEPWQGLDRIIRGMARAPQGIPGGLSIELHIVGNGAALKDLQELVSELDLGQSVIFHGPSSGLALDDLLTKAHVGVGSLGRHRTGNEGGQTTTLKAREYALRGLPFFQSMVDHDFGTDYRYCLRVPSHEDAIDLSDVVKWYLDLARDTPDFATWMYHDAVKRLSWTRKLKPVHDFLHA